MSGTSTTRSRIVSRYYVITKNPSDFPGCIVVRGWSLEAVEMAEPPRTTPDGIRTIVIHGTAVRQVPDDDRLCAFTFDPAPDGESAVSTYEIEALRLARKKIESVAPHLRLMERSDDDDPVIVETWL